MNHTFDKLKLATIVCATALAGNAVYAGDAVKMSDWDTDSNGTVSLAEWDTAIEKHELFDNLDANGNGVFEIEESAGIDFPEFDLDLDLDDGGYIERQEFTVGLFQRYDENDDDKLDSEEFKTFADKSMDSDLLTSR